MGLFRVTCAKCGASIARNVRFCPHCGAAQGTGKVRCSQCGQEVTANAAFCPFCGQRMSTSRAPEIRDNRWRRAQEDFATRVVIDDVRGFFAREFIVEPGTQAVILADGTNLGVVGPGRYTMDTLIERAEVFLNLRSAHRVEAILLDVADTDLQFNVTRLFTSDPLPVDLGCRVVTRVGNPVLFLQALIKGQGRYGLEQLRDYLYLEVQGAAQEWMSGHGIAELAKDMKLRDELEIALSSYLHQTMDRTGLKLVQVRAMELSHEYLNRVTQERARVFLQISEEQARFEGRKRLFDLAQQSDLQEMAEETAKVEQQERRAAVWDRMRRAVLSDRMSEIRSEGELEAFLREQDKQKLIGDREYDEIKRSFAEEREDHELQRRYLERKVEMEWQKELDRMALQGETELLELRLKRREMELQAQLQEERTQAIERKQIDIELRQRELQTKLQEAKTQAEIAAIQREQDRLDIELGVHALELMDARRLRKQREEMLLQAEQEEKALERRLHEERARHDLEMERLQQLSQVSAEVLISVSGPEQAQMLADLHRTQALAGMTEDQILALAAERSPEVARAFQEKFRALSPERQAEMYERLLKDRETATTQLAQALQEAARMQQETAFRAMDTQRDISVAYAQAGGQAPVIVTPGVGSAATPAGTGERAVVCPRCHAESPVGTRFCQNCGHAFYESDAP